MGAMKVSLDFSAASMRIVKIRWAVRNYERVSVSRAFGVMRRAWSFLPHRIITYHLEEKTLRHIHVRRQRSLHNRDVGWNDTADHSSSAHGPKNLSREQDEASEGWERSGDHHAECDGWVE